MVAIRKILKTSMKNLLCVRLLTLLCGISLVCTRQKRCLGWQFTSPEVCWTTATNCRQIRGLCTGGQFNEWGPWSWWWPTREGCYPHTCTTATRSWSCWGNKVCTNIYYNVFDQYCTPLSLLWNVKSPCLSPLAAQLRKGVEW